jgi:YVTN family beta-propeller protein
MHFRGSRPSLWRWLRVVAAVAVVAGVGIGSIGVAASSQQRGVLSAAAAQTGTCGKTSVGATSDTFASERKRVNKCALPVNATMTELSLYLAPAASSGQQVLKGVVYADASGSPGALLGITSELSFASSSASGWYHLPLTSPLALNAGNYWIGVFTGAQSRVAGFRYDSVSAARDYNSNAYASGPSNPFGSFTTDSEQMSLYATYTSSSSEAPTVLTEAASEVAQTSAKLNGSVNPNGHEVTECVFEYGTGPTYGKTAPCSPAPGSGTGAVKVSAAIPGLGENTTYHFRVFAKNAGGPSTGADETFKTNVPPPPPTGTAAADSFQRTVASGWGSAEKGGWWTVVGSPWNWSVSAGTGNVAVGAGGEELAYLSTFTVQDVDVLDQVVLPRCAGSSNCGAYVLGRYSPAYQPTYYRVGVVQGAGKPDIFIRAQRSDGSNLTSDIDTGLPAADGAAVLLRVEFTGTNPTTVRARAWLAGTAEPTTWPLTVTDNTAAEQSAGMLGVQLHNEDTAASHSFGVQSYQATGSATPVTPTPNPTGPAHLLYVVNDGTVYVYDIDNAHKLVKQFPIPEAGKRGLIAEPNHGLLYISECGLTTCGPNGKGHLIAYDLVHDVVAWIANYTFGTDQGAIAPDGSKIYMSHGEDSTDGNWTVLDPSDGKPTASIETGTGDGGHNTIFALDGSEVYLSGHYGNTAHFVHVVNPSTNQITREVGPLTNGVGPFTINGKHTLAFTTSIQTCGFQVSSLTTGSVLYTLAFGGSCSWGTGDPTHGISLSPDEKRVYIVDAPLDQLEVYDVSGLPSVAPTAVASIPLSSLSGSESPCENFCEREGWVLNELSGRYVYVGDSGDVVDTSTNAVIANLPALRNTRQLIEIDWTNGVPSGTSTRFGLGRVTK